MVPHAEIIEIAAFERDMVHPRRGRADDGERVVVGPGRALVEVHEAGQNVGLLIPVDQLRRLHPKGLAIPGDHLLGSRREQGDMAKALGVRGTIGRTLERAQALLRMRVVPQDRGVAGRNRRRACRPEHEFEPTAIRIAADHIEAASWMGAFRHRGAELGRQLIQRLAARRPESDADEGGVALAGDVGERRVAVAAHVEAVTLPLEIE